jgi:hypothetical protein
LSNGWKSKLAILAVKPAMELFQGSKGLNLLLLVVVVVGYSILTRFLLSEISNDFFSI